MNRFAVLPIAICLSLFASLPSQAQQQPFPEISFCPAGVQADGFINWSTLPANPPRSGGITASLPITGTSNLSATFTIPDTASTNGPFYQIVNATDLVVQPGANPTITFNRPVKGVRVTFQTAGRFGHDFKMTAFTVGGGQLNTLPSSPPPPAQVSSSGFDYVAGLLSVSPLAIRSIKNDIASVQFTFTGDDGEYPHYHLINLRIETDSAPDPSLQVPLNGLREWLRADHANAPGVAPPGLSDGNPLVSWPDDSKKGSEAFPISPSATPLVVPSGPHCTPVVNFSQPTPTPLHFNLPINGWTNMTVFLAAQAYTDTQSWFNQPLIWNETAAWGTTFFSPSQTSASFRFGTTQVNNQPTYPRLWDIGGDFSVTTAVHDSNVDSLYVNGALVSQQGGKLSTISGTQSTAVVGSGLNNTPFTGNVGEILVYDRVLTDTERQTVERYLIGKYGTH
jgi:hypothetical protein